MTHLVDNLRFVWLGSASGSAIGGLLSLREGWIVGRLEGWKVEMSESLFVELVDPSSCSINKVKWLQCHKMSLSKQSLITCLFEWAWAVSSETRGSWIIKSALDCGDTHWSFYYMVPTDKADDIVGRKFFTVKFFITLHTPCTRKSWQCF